VIVIFYVQMSVCQDADLEANKGAQLYAQIVEAAQAL
jgi:hypothetical protein